MTQTESPKQEQSAAEKKASEKSEEKERLQRKLADREKNKKFKK